MHCARTCCLCVRLLGKSLPIPPFVYEYLAKACNEHMRLLVRISKDIYV